LQRQFGVIDAKGKAGIKLKNMKQGRRSVTEYSNEFHLVASEAELDDSTGGALLLGGMNTELQNALGLSSKEYEDLEVLAQWAIRKETKLTSVRHIQGSTPTKNMQRETHHDGKLVRGTQVHGNAGKRQGPYQDQNTTTR